MKLVYPFTFVVSLPAISDSPAFPSSGFSVLRPSVLFRHGYNNAPVPAPLRYAHSLPLPSQWELKKEFATRFLSFGTVHSALSIFERLEMWEEVVKCWQAMEWRDMGIGIVRGLLERRKAEAEAVLARGKAETTEARRANMDLAREAKLWCFLGDLEPENAAEQRAWAVSGQTAGRAIGDVRPLQPLSHPSKSVQTLLTHTHSRVPCPHAHVRHNINDEPHWIGLAPSAEMAIRHTDPNTSTLEEVVTGLIPTLFVIIASSGPARQLPTSSVVPLLGQLIDALNTTTAQLSTNAPRDMAPTFSKTLSSPDFPVLITGS
ncbi:hypothetical protein DFH08DRAFT_986658 [Mycena albidolilacea]|uniref:Uncharacterized protein n=1 Tax=Mycena albidolilacea TaxID=1033008 RepID=A0AAD6Z1Y9_9AGAR|nr:hypothetical protein DFH08DRAFT_986658 [Mycena albidolilacea]